MSNKVELEIDPDDVLTGADETERQRQILMFIMTAKELYREDGIGSLTDSEIGKWLLGSGGHRGKGLAALSETLVLLWRKEFNVDTILTEDFIAAEKSGRLQYFGNALDGSCIIVWNGSKYVGPKTESEREKEMRYIVYFIESGRKKGILTDKLTIIFDKTGMRADKEDIKLASYIIPILQKHYPERLSRMYLFPTNTIFWMGWKMITYFLSPATVPKIILKDSPAALYEWISRENYFKRYGGLANDPYDDLEKSKPVEKESAVNQKVLKTNVVSDLKVVEELWSAPLEYQDI
ncbi:hypothetical protein HDV06_003823 [Boothiomyces sp. JEL0866]|nr:hypothetical protein HDV06_003823 [Boothiomyces sp. JEL0866]